jgi:GT2 family glycosyltransferase
MRHGGPGCADVEMNGPAHALDGNSMDIHGNELPTPGSVDLSVIVSTFNRRESLKRTIDSVLVQRVSSGIHYELIVVDNNCTDGTRDVIADYVRRYPKHVRYAFEPRQGVSYGRNAGIRAARGAIVAFTDDDNEVSRTWIATILRLLSEHPEAAGVGGKVLPEWPRTPPAWLDRLHWSPLAILDYGERPFFTSAQRPLCLLTANLAIRRRVLLDLGGFSPAFPRCQDHELLLRLWRAGGRVLYAPELVTVAPVDETRMTRSYHRRWHARHGYHAATMRLEEAVDEHGRLRASPPQALRLLGTPGYIYADAARHACRWAIATCRHQHTRAVHHAHRLRYLASYIRHTATLSRSVRPGLATDLMRFAAGHALRRAESVNMSPLRMAAAHLLVALLVGGSAWDILTGREHWPLSPYPMFSSVERSPTLDSLLLAGVPEDPTAQEVPLRDAAYIAPFDQCRLTTALRRARSIQDGGLRLRAMLADSLLRYEARRENGAHDGPPLRALRVYDAHWTLDPSAANVDAPDRKTLLAEVIASRTAQFARVGN